MNRFLGRDRPAFSRYDKSDRLSFQKSYLSITNLRTGITWWSERAMDYFGMKRKLYDPQHGKGKPEDPS